MSRILSLLTPVAALAIGQLSGACATAEPAAGSLPGPGSPGVDAGPSTGPAEDADLPDAPPELTSLPPVLSEVVLSPTGAEFIEIYNPGPESVALGEIYLADSAEYALVPGIHGAGPAPAIGGSDFIVKFPAGTSLESGGVATVAVDGTGFELAFGMPADYCLAGSNCVMMGHVVVGGGTATLTNSGEPIVLFSWDGADDHVADLDMIRVGTPSAGNELPNKSGLAVDGPDADLEATAYPEEAYSMPTQTSAPGDGESTKRLSMPVGEVSMSSNTATGYDETSEDISTTWDDDDSYTAPTPGEIPNNLHP